MRTSGRDGAFTIWSAFRRSSRRLAERVKPGRSGIFFLLPLAAIALCTPHRLDAAEATITGKIANGPQQTGASGTTISDQVAEAHFAEPLVPTTPTSREDDRALLRAVAGYERRSNPDDFRHLTRYLSAHPHTGWRVALLTNLGLSYLHYGYFSRAIDAWETAWREGRNAAEARAKALVDRAVGELVLLHAELGHAERLALLLEEIGDRPVSGPATEPVQSARETLWLMRNDPRHLFLCGPMALKILMLGQGATLEDVRFLNQYRTGPKGVSLAEVARLAEEARLPYQPIFRKPGQPVPVPSIMHWKVGHFAAIVGEANGRFLVKDPVLGVDGLFVTKAALDAEASGYFLAPAKEEDVAKGWRKVATEDAGRVWGAGPTAGRRLGDSGDSLAKPAPPPPRDGTCGMCGTNIKEMTVGLMLSDTPVGYTPPKGPPVKITLTYNQREDSQPANFNFFNVSPKWTLNWLSYVQDDPGANQAGVNVSRYLPGGGAYYYTGFNFLRQTGPFNPQDNDASVLTLVSRSPISYQRALNDGSIEIYAQSDGGTTYPRRVFLTKVIDPQGNAVTLNYDAQRRLVSLTDATGRQTTFSYGRAGSPLLITQITDPFGRSATLAYDGSGRLSSITDVLGLTSSFTYDASSLVNSMTTPYGTTRFAYGASSTSTFVNSRFVQITDPLGNSEREEFVQPAPVPASDPIGIVPKGMNTIDGNLQYRSSFHWDPHAYVVAGCTPTGGCNYTRARHTHFVHDATNSNFEGTTVESRKNPLENRVWFNYPGQASGPTAAGTYQLPTAIGRVLDDGTTQLTRLTYNAFGKITQAIDPVGRTTQLAYAANQIDLSTVTQSFSAGPAAIGQFTYNPQHRPLTYTDAAGQTTQYGYNTTGQLTSVTDQLGQKTSFQYDPTGYLATIINANGKVAASFTRDTFGRVATYTDSEGWTISYSYDAADRVTRITYPDGTTDQYTWDKLDLAAYRDRQGHLWSYSHDADRRLVAATDPLGNQTQFGYYENGRLKSLTDPNGHQTVWDIDVQSRPAAKHYADGTQAIYAYEQTMNRLKSVTDALGQIKQYTYKVDDRLSGISYLNALNPTPKASFAWDASWPRVTSMTDGTGTTQYSYVPVGALGALRLQQETGPLPNGAIAYAYDALGRVGTRTVGGGVQETFKYDPIGRLTAHADGLGQFALSYLGETSQIVQRQLVGANVATSWTYLNNAGDRRLAAIGNAGLRQYQYTTTPENLITGIAEQACYSGPCTALRNWSMAYDNADRLRSANVARALSPYSYTLDPAGNITLFQPGSKAAVYNSVNELASFAGQPFVHDANGNLTSDGQRNYAWDAENRLVGVSYVGQPGKRTAFAYDGLDRRKVITTTTGGSAVSTGYLWCGSQLCQARNADNTVARSYYDEGEVIPAASMQLYYAPDQIGSVRDVLAVGATSTTAQAYDFDPYGNPTQVPVAGRMPDFRYAGMFYHTDSGLYLTNRRAYDSRTAHWLSRDPIGETGGINLYAYANNNPVSLIDPKGLKDEPPSTKSSSLDRPDPQFPQKACPPNEYLVCVTNTPPLSVDRSLPGYQPEQDFGGVGYCYADPDDPKSGEVKWVRYNCLYFNGQRCSFIGPGSGDDGYGVETRPWTYEGVGSTVPITPNIFVVDPTNPQSVALSKYFWLAFKHQYQKCPC
jgi:RHS repeat-associated protein